MKLDLFLSKTSNIVAENRLLKFVVVVLGISTVWCIYKTSEAVHHQKIILIPAHLDERIVIEGDNVNDGYIKIFAGTVMNLLLSYTPQTCELQYGELLRYISSSQYAVFKAKLVNLLDSVKKIQITSDFWQKELKIDREKKEIFVSGIRRKYTGTTLIEETADEYVIKYKIVDGKFNVDSISEVGKKNI